jgi:hypothetical protein
MACYIHDIDGTLVYYHTNTWLPGAVERLTRLIAEGHQLVFVTMRGPQDEGEEWSMGKTDKLLAELPFPGWTVLYSTQSPRYLFDDSHVEALRVPHNVDWTGCPDGL